MACLGCDGTLLRLLFFSCCLANISFAFPKDFPVGNETKYKVWFWEQVFASYNSRQVLIHDASKPYLIIDVISLPANSKFKQENLKKKVTKYLDRYKLGLRRFKKNKRKAILMGSVENRLYQVYSQDADSLKALLAGRVMIRTQLGLSDQFSKAAKVAEKYLPQMEKIFEAEGIPLDLTRIPFVESMFQLNAFSKAGAKGIWQLMPATARKYLTVNRFIDERNSPFKASLAAARFLRDNHDKLQSWPLAVTAYNHGVYGMLRAVKATGSKDLDEIVSHYRSPSFKFASKNFYAEFIAARNTYNRDYLRSSMSRKNLQQTVEIQLPKNLAISQLIRYTPLTESLIKRFNPCLKPVAFQKQYRFAPILKNYSIFVPTKIANQVESKLKKISL